MAWIWKAFDALQEYLTSLAPQPVTSFLPRPIQLNDYVYEVCKPTGRPSIEIIFFHGLQLDGSKEAFFTTWLSRDGSEFWPRWIAERFSEARILLVSYDGSVRRKDDQGNTDMYITGENVVHSLTDDAAQVGRDGCPVVLVGHCLGGLVMKEFLLQANSLLSLDSPDNPNENVQCLLESVKGLFYYATPHHGSRFADIETDFSKALLVKRISVLNKKAARCNEDFRKLRQKNRWRAYGIAESLPVTLGAFEDKLVVGEASTRCDVDTLYTVQANHFDVCRPKSTADSSFTQLMDVIDRALQEDVPGHKMPFSNEVIGLDHQVQIVIQALKRARRLGIVGTGGMGKSTLAKAVFDSISAEFEYTCFLSNVKNTINKEDSMEVLQEKISGSLYYKGRRKVVNWSRLKGKKIFFILDDVEHASQVYPRLEGFSNESCVLVTSRDRRFVRSMGFEVYEIMLLDDEASLRLFCLYAFKRADVPEVYKTRVTLFVKKCGGLPLALEVTGKYLSTQKEGRVWDGAYNRLSQAKALDGRNDDDLWSIFKVIYDSLGGDEKEMFLDIATCFHGEELESVKPAWRACSWAESSTDISWQNLLDKGLVTMTPFREKDRHGTWIEDEDIQMMDMWTEDRCIQMHEVLRDLGRSIACTNKKIDQKSTRVCYDVFDQLPAWPFNQKKPNFEVRILKIVFNGGPHYPRPKIDIDSLSGLENLEILWLDGVSLFGAWNQFPDKLEFLKLKRCYWGDKDDFERSSKGIAVEGSSSRRGASSEKSGEHPTLRHFVIERFEDLQHLLDTLDLDTGGPWQALENLRFLEGKDTLGQDFPVPLETLKTLHFKRRSSKALDTLGRHTWVPWETSENLEVERSSSESLHAALGLHTWVPWKTSENLEVERSSPEVGVQALPDTFEQLRHIRIDDYTIIISRCSGLAAPTKNLSISVCWLRALPDTLGELRRLRHLVISRCPVLVFLPATLGELGALEHLEISHCEKLQALPRTIGRLPRLRHFKISHCPGLDRLPYTLGELTALQRLEMSYCDGLETLPESFGELTALEHLEISYCAKLKLNVHDYRRMYWVLSLEQLDRQQCAAISIRGLRHLVISKCPVLDRLPDILRDLPHLEHLEISDCETFIGLPYTIERFEPRRALRHFVILNCPSLYDLPYLSGELPVLEHLEISDCDRLQAFPLIIGPLPRLRHLVISNCPRLDSLPDTLGELPALEHIEISQCYSLQALPNSLRQLLGGSPCNLCGKSGHWEINCPLKQLEGQLKYHHLTVANLSRNKRNRNVTEISQCSGLQALPNSLRQLPGGSSCNLCGKSGHSEIDCPLKQLESQLKHHHLTVANLSRNKHNRNVMGLVDPPEDSDDGSDEAEDPPDDSDDGGDEPDGNSLGTMIC